MRVVDIKEIVEKSIQESLDFEDAEFHKILGIIERLRLKRRYLICA